MNRSTGKPYQNLVAYIMKAFDPGAEVRTGEWIKGPDGRLDMDVSVRGAIEGKPILIVIECKDFDIATTGKVGRPFIDALDSKRLDLKADIALICSNSGFTEDALNKASRKGIGTISILSESDKRIKVIIESEIYFRKINLNSLLFTYHGADFRSYGEIKVNELKYNGQSVDAWLQRRASLIVMANPMVTHRLNVTFNLKPNSKFEIRGKEIKLDRLDISFSPKTNWFSQIVQFDAALGMFDYLRHRIRLVSGDNRYIIKGLNFDTGKPISSAPQIREDTNLLLGEIVTDFAMIEGFITNDEKLIAKLEEIVNPEDLKVEM